MLAVRRARGVSGGFPPSSLPRVHGALLCALCTVLCGCTVDLRDLITSALVAVEVDGARSGVGAVVDLGELQLGVEVEISLVLRNVGNSELALSGTPPVAFSGAHASFFRIEEEIPPTVAVRALADLTVLCLPTAATEDLEATVTVLTNDPRAASFTVELDGSVVGQHAATPIISVYQGSGSSAAAIASGTGRYEFDAVDADGDGDATSGAVTFTIGNTGDADLLIGSISLASGDSGDFDLAGPASTTVPGGSATTFTIVFDPLRWGAKTATVRIVHNDCDLSPYTFAVSGSGNEPSLCGYVTDGTDPVGGALLRLYDDGLTVDEHDSSDWDGYYAFFDVAPGTYYLVVHRDGFAPETRVVTVP